MHHAHPGINSECTETVLTSSGSSTRTQNLTQQEIDQKPWKYVGYRGYVAFLASDTDFFILRRFATASTRVALALQDQVSVLEAELEELDKRYSRMDAEDISNGCFRDDEQDRIEIIDKLHDKLTKYNEFILQQAAVRKHPDAFSQDIQSLEVWHYNHPLAISENEHKYLAHKRDLFSVVPREKTPLRRLLDRWTGFRGHSLWRERKKAPELPMYDRDLVSYISDKRIDRFITFIIVGLGTAMLIAPMWILQAIQSSSSKLGVITTFVIVFLGMVSYTTVAKPFEVLAATAGYSAVLMVFLQLGGTSTQLS